MGVLVDLRESKIPGVQMGQCKLLLYNTHLRYRFFLNVSLSQPGWQAVYSVIGWNVKLPKA